MKVLFDTNVVLDVMLDRYPFSDNAAKLISYVENKQLIGFIAATTITTINYIAEKVIGKKKAITEIEKLLIIFDIAPINKNVLKGALKLEFKDFEDAVLNEAGNQANVEVIVTRNTKDFKKATIPVYTPDEFLDKVIKAN